jgi:hypothetical protein
LCAVCTPPRVQSSNCASETDVRKERQRSARDGREGAAKCIVVAAVASIRRRFAKALADSACLPPSPSNSDAAGRRCAPSAWKGSKTCLRSRLDHRLGLPPCFFRSTLSASCRGPLEIPRVLSGCGPRSSPPLPGPSNCAIAIRPKLRGLHRPMRSALRAPWVKEPTIRSTTRSLATTWCYWQAGPLSRRNALPTPRHLSKRRLR